MIWKKPKLTIDFVGLCAFVEERGKDDCTRRVHVLIVDAEKAAPSDETLCRHDPMVVYDGRMNGKMTDFHSAGTGTQEDRRSFSDVRAKEVEMWDLRGGDCLGKDLVLKVDEKTKTPLEIKRSYRNVLRLGDLIAGGGGEVNPDWVYQKRPPGVVARLTIDHGRLEGVRWSDEAWGIAPRGETPSKYRRFRRGVRWKVYAEPPKPYEFLALMAGGQEEWIEFEDRAHLVVSNLCPLTLGSPPVSEDVLAFHGMATVQVPQPDRNVLYRETRAGGTGGVPVRPGSDACPPVTGHVSI